MCTPSEAWDVLRHRKTKYYDIYSAAWSGNIPDLIRTSEPGTFWSRPGKARVHVPLAADIVTTSSNLLFGEEPRFDLKCDKVQDDIQKTRQNRLDEIIRETNFCSRLAEAAESAAALGDVYLKINWDKEGFDVPLVMVVQGDSALPEYRGGRLLCIHFFTVLKMDERTGKTWRLYERYEKGRITSEIYSGSEGDLGTPQSSAALKELNITPEVKCPIDELLAVHIANTRPNRMCRDSPRGRSDLEGLRGMLDALDETYSSWIRDIRLSKSRLIVPVDYLRRKPAEMLEGNACKYEFDEDVETLVALDIDTDKTGGITSSQFAIRAQEHRETVVDLVRNIVSMAGYSPQTFGLDVDGNAQSGTALRIREKKSFATKDKKEKYWKSVLERFLTAIVHLDAQIYPEKGLDGCDCVSVTFADGTGNDLAVIAEALEKLRRAQAISIETAVKMLHPDWTDQQAIEETEWIKRENGLIADSPDFVFGDFAPVAPLGAQLPAEPEEIFSGGD